MYLHVDILRDVDPSTTLPLLTVVLSYTYLCRSALPTQVLVSRYKRDHTIKLHLR